MTIGELPIEGIGSYSLTGVKGTVRFSGIFDPVEKNKPAFEAGKEYKFYSDDEKALKAKCTGRDGERYTFETVKAETA